MICRLLEAQVANHQQAELYLSPNVAYFDLVTRGNRELRAVGYGRIPNWLSIVVNKLPCEPQPINSRTVSRRELHEHLYVWCNPYQPRRRLQWTTGVLRQEQVGRLGEKGEVKQYNQRRRDQRRLQVSFYGILHAKRFQKACVVEPIRFSIGDQCQYRER